MDTPRRHAIGQTEVDNLYEPDVSTLPAAAAAAAPVEWLRRPLMHKTLARCIRLNLDQRLSSVEQLRLSVAEAETEERARVGRRACRQTNRRHGRPTSVRVPSVDDRRQLGFTFAAPETVRCPPAHVQPVHD